MQPLLLVFKLTNMTFIYILIEKRKACFLCFSNVNRYKQNTNKYEIQNCFWHKSFLLTGNFVTVCISHLIVMKFAVILGCCPFLGNIIHLHYGKWRLSSVHAGGLYGSNWIPLRNVFQVPTASEPILKIWVPALTSTRTCGSRPPNGAGTHQK